MIPLQDLSGFRTGEGRKVVACQRLFLDQKAGLVSAFEKATGLSVSAVSRVLHNLALSDLALN